MHKSRAGQIRARRSRRAWQAERGVRMPMSRPVSYTHLDVYKRQVMARVERQIFHLS